MTPMMMALSDCGPHLSSDYSLLFITNRLRIPHIAPFLWSFSFSPWRLCVVIWRILDRRRFATVAAVNYHYSFSFLSLSLLSTKKATIADDDLRSLTLPYWIVEARCRHRLSDVAQMIIIIYTRLWQLNCNIDRDVPERIVKEEDNEF